jgi:hypothetical protein
MNKKKFEKENNREHASLLEKYGILPMIKIFSAVLRINKYLVVIYHQLYLFNLS